MSTVFGTLAGLCLVALCVELIKPGLMKMGRKKAIALFLSGAFVFFIIYCVTVPPEPETQVVVAPVYATSTVEGQIEEVADKAAPGLTNEGGKTHLESVLVTPDVNGGWDVHVALNADDNLSENLIKVGVQNQIAKEFFSLYTATSTISKVSIDVSMPVTDKYGNKQDTVIYSASLDKTTADKMNWSSDDALNLLPGVWSVDSDDL